jgi:serine/threonine-protein kinase
MEFNVIDERYIISADVGHGGYATVFLAFDQIRRKQVAIKVINCDINNDKKAYNMFQQEAMTMAAISNLNVVSIYGSGIYNNKPYLVMDYVRGKSLKDIIRENSYLLVDEVYTYMMQIINGLEACHNCNIVHRDIKPQNIIKKTDGNVVLIDFGTAYIGEVERNLYVEDGAIIIGTIQLLAPEL